MCIIKIVLSWYKATFLIFENRAYFSVMSIASIDRKNKTVCMRNHYRSKVCNVIADKGEMSKNKLWICDPCMLNVCFKNTACLSTFVKMSLNNSEEKIGSVY